jgi:hypothetical protein
MSYSGIWDGFDHYDAAHEVWNSSNSPLYSSAYARFGAAPGCVAQGMRLGASGSKTKILKANVQTVIFSFAFMVAAPPSLANGIFVNAQDNGTNQAGFTIEPNLSMTVRRTPSGTILGTTAPGVLTAGAWAWLDLVLNIATSGYAQIYINTPLGPGGVPGVPVLSATGINTQQSANAYCNIIQIGDLAINIDQYTYWDDFHCHDAGGVAPNGILGAGTRIYTKMPNAPGALSNWTPTGAGANWDCVQEVPPDDDTTYVLAGSSVEDNYGIASAGIGASNTVNGIVRRSRMRMDDAGPHTFQNGIRSNGVDQLGGIASVASGYAYTDSCSIIDPNTGQPWTAAAADIATPIIYRTT